MVIQIYIQIWKHDTHFGSKWVNRMQILFACYLNFVAIFYTSPEADIGLHTDGIRAVILCAVRKFGFFCNKHTGKMQLYKITSVFIIHFSLIYSSKWPTSNNIWLGKRSNNNHFSRQHCGWDFAWYQHNYFPNTNVQFECWKRRPFYQLDVCS